MMTVGSSKWLATARLVAVVLMASPCAACGRFFLSDEVSRTPAVAAQDGSPVPSTATAWVERVEPGFVQVVGKVFEGGDSVAAGDAPLRPLSPLVPVSTDPGAPDPLGVISGLDLVRVDDGFLVVWSEDGGPVRAQFTDATLATIGSPIFITNTTAALGRIDISVYWVEHRDRAVLFMDLPDTGGRLTYATFDTQTRALLRVMTLPFSAPFSDVSYDPNPNRTPFMVAYLSPSGGLEDPFTVRAAFVDFFDVDSETLFVVCATDVSSTSTVDFNNVAGGTQLGGQRYVAWDQRNGDIYGTFVLETCSVGFEAYLGSRRIVNDFGQQPPRSFFRMDVRFDADGDGLLVFEQGLPSDAVTVNLVYVVGVLPLHFDGLRINPGTVQPIGVPERGGDPRMNISFDLESDLEGFKLVFDEVEVDEDRRNLDDTWSVLFDLLDEDGNTIGPF